MRRLFGVKAKETSAPPPSLDDVNDGLQKRVDNVESKIKKIDDELMVLKQKMARTTGATHAHLKQEAARLIKEKRMWMGEKQKMSMQMGNMSRMQYQMSSMEATKAQVAALEATSVAMKAQAAAFDVDKVAELQDDLDDLTDDFDQVQEILGRNTMMDYEDDIDVDGELGALDDEMMPTSADLGNLLDEAKAPTSMPVRPQAQEASTDPADLEKQLGLGL